MRFAFAQSIDVNIYFISIFITVSLFILEIFNHLKFPGLNIFLVAGGNDWKLCPDCISFLQ